MKTGSVDPIGASPGTLVPMRHLETIGPFSACLSLILGDMGRATGEVPGQVDRYQVVDRVGKGGMAQVFHARLQGLGGFERAGAEWIHVVDLDGAKTGEPKKIGDITLERDGDRVTTELSSGQFESEVVNVRQLGLFE